MNEHLLDYEEASMGDKRSDDEDVLACLAARPHSLLVDSFSVTECFIYWLFRPYVILETRHETPLFGHPSFLPLCALPLTRR